MLFSKRNLKIFLCILNKRTKFSKKNLENKEMVFKKIRLIQAESYNSTFTVLKMDPTLAVVCG